MHDPIEDALNIYQLGWNKFSSLPAGKKTKKVILTIIIKTIYAIMGAVIGFAADFAGIRLGGVLGSGKSSDLAFNEISDILVIGMLICAVFFVIYGDIILGHFYKTMRKRY
jgi:hypothetical protein